MVSDTSSNGEEEDEEDIEQLELTGARLDAAPEHLKQIPIVDMIDFGFESYQNEIYDKSHGVAKSGNNVDIIMDGEIEFTNPARDLSIDAKPGESFLSLIPHLKSRQTQILLTNNTTPGCLILKLRLPLRLNPRRLKFCPRFLLLRLQA